MAFDTVSPAYYDWFNTAERAGIADAAAVAFYDASPHLYRVSIAGTTVACPVLTTPDWLGARAFDSITGHDLNDPLYHHDSAAVDACRARLARLTGEPIEEDSNRLFNGSTFIPRLRSLTDAHVDFVESDYFSKLATDHQLRNELFRVLYQTGCSPTTPATGIRTLLADRPLPNRESIAPDLPTFLTSQSALSTPFGVNGATIVNTGSSYALLVARRSPSVHVYPGWWGSLPAGGVEPTGRPNPFRSTLYKEFGEELLGVDEHTGDSFSHPGIAALNRLLDQQQAHIDCTGVIVTAPRLGTCLMGSILIDDPAYYRDHLRDTMRPDGEHDAFELIPLDDGAELEQWLLRSDLVPVTRPILCEALRHVRATYDVSIGISIDRVAP